MTTREYCLLLLDDVDQAGRDPELAYLVRSRLRRAVIGLERGRRGEPDTPPAATGSAGDSGTNHGSDLPSDLAVPA